jgi:hypothetical protein
MINKKIAAPGSSAQQLQSFRQDEHSVLPKSFRSAGVQHSQYVAGRVIAPLLYILFYFIINSQWEYILQCTFIDVLHVFQADFNFV